MTDTSLNKKSSNDQAHRRAPTLVDDSRLVSVARRVGTPCYIYDEQRIRQSLERFKDVPYLNTSIRFASMANDNKRLLTMVRQAGFGLFVNSLKHLDVALQCGYEVKDVVFASTGISPALMGKLAELGVQVNLDSRQQVQLYGSVARGGKAGIRLNIDERSKNDPHNGLGSRIGVLESEFEGVKQAAATGHITLNGTHIYPGTDITQLDDVLGAVDKALALSSQFPDVEFVDLGGGFPIDRTRFDLERYKNEVARMLAEFSRARGKPIQLIIEPGRAMFGDTAVFCSTVTDVKSRPDRVLVFCDASATLLPRAMFYEDYNPVHVAGADRKKRFNRPVDIAGSTTYSRDYLTRGVELSETTPGDLLVFGNAGSYCYSMITRFLGQALPPEYLLTVDGQLELIREGESFFMGPAS